MLGLIFSISVASSIIWLVWVYKYIIENIGFEKLLAYAPNDLFTVICAVIIPIAIIWIIATFVIQALSNVKHNRWLRKLLKQSKTSIEYSEAVTRTMIEASSQIKSGFTMNNIEFTISDLNEIIAEIISKTNIKTKSEIIDLWKLNKYGSKWGFSKAFLEYTKINDDYYNTILEKSRKDKLLAGSILEFCSKYIRLIEVLEKHDREKLIQESFENGVIGRVFSILAPIADNIQNKSSQIEVKTYKLEASEPDKIDPLFETNDIEEIEKEIPKEKKSFIKSIFGKKEKEKIEPIMNYSEPIIEEENFNDKDLNIFEDIEEYKTSDDIVEEINDDLINEYVITTEYTEENEKIEEIEQESNFQSAEEFFNKNEYTFEEKQIETITEENIDIEEYIENINDEPIDLDNVSENIVDNIILLEEETKDDTSFENNDDEEETDPNREKMIADLQKQWEEIKNNQ